MNKMKLFLLMLFVTVFPTNVIAANEYTDAKYGGTVSDCTNEYQDKNISTSNIAYYSYCMKAVCQNSYGSYKYGIDYYYSTSELKRYNMIVSCNNGNKNPYVTLHKNGCTNYTSCNTLGDTKYCSTIWKYDCTKNSDGTIYGTKKTTTKRTTKKIIQTKKTTQSTTEAPVISNKLKSLSLSKGSILFNSETYEYSITLNNEDSFVEVYAIAEDNNATVEVKNNDNLVDGSVIEIIVNAPNNSSSIYKINVSKQMVLSNNANLTNGSKITVTVEAEDGTVKYYYINILVKAKSNVFGIIFIIIIILAILAGAYYLYKKFVLSKSGDKYEYE